MLIMNALDEDQSVTACGSTFFFKGREVKNITNQNIAFSITHTKKEFGFVELPEELSHLSYLRKGETIESRATPEELAIVEAKRKEGVDAYITRLRSLVYNAQVSLVRDLARKDYKHDPRFEYSEGEVKSMSDLLKYQSRKDDIEKLKVDKIKEIEKKLEENKR